ncbi:C39 family peptidase [Desulfogranum marinum]|uniref:C39 family peptidase n=1 Tax=Desulfogranum marinum TaxID=453220 RepID=UPI0019628A03|nr:C39 family peptidase [Desulfogranum marinum]MBM9513714.1 C39 family peptidase [Desulfogranum marinum]
MNQNYLAYSSKAFTILMIVTIVLSIGIPGCGLLSGAHAQNVEKLSNKTSSPSISVVSSLEKSEYFTSRTISISGIPDLVDVYIINAPSVPPPGFDIERRATALPVSDSVLGTRTLVVPAFNWVFGCSSVSGAMIAGYYDRRGYVNIYTGPTNGGVMPLDNSSWPRWSDGYSTYPNLPLAASRKGVDARAARGSIDDYWVQYNYNFDDPYISNSWTQHVWGEAIGDYMKTSQSAYGNSDGATSFYNWSSSANPLTCSEMASSGISDRDGTYGRKLFYEARGYTVTDCYSQKTDNTIVGGFSFAQFKAEIDAGRPLMLNLEGHTIVGVGYDDSSNTVYIHDTWDYNTHTMTWGGSYSGMQLLSVSIVNLQEEELSTLAESLDNRTLTWSTGGNAGWYGQSSTVYYGGDAAQSGVIGNSQQSYFETVVSGPGTISFYWQVSSELYYDYLRFYIDGEEKTGAISGTTSWALQRHNITTSGSHVLRWVYTKDGSVSESSDCGWVDKVTWAPEAQIRAPIMPWLMLLLEDE